MTNKGKRNNSDQLQHQTPSDSDCLRLIKQIQRNSESNNRRTRSPNPTLTGYQRRLLSVSDSDSGCLSLTHVSNADSSDSQLRLGLRNRFPTQPPARQPQTQTDSGSRALSPKMTCARRNTAHPGRVLDKPPDMDKYFKMGFASHHISI